MSFFFFMVRTMERWDLLVLPHFALWNVLKINAIKRLTPHFMAFRATFPPPEKNIFLGPQVVRPQWLKMMQYEVGMKKRWKKVWEKFAGSEKVPTFAIPLRNKGTSLRRTSWADGVWKSGPEGLKYRKVHWKDWRKYKEASTKTQRTRALISFRN